MPPDLVLLGCYVFIAWLLYRDTTWRDAGTKALWIPGIWIAIIGSRPVSYWVGASGGNSGEAHPVNTLVFGILLFAALVVLIRRRVNWGEVIGTNKALFALVFFLALSAVWSEMPFVSFKRLLKDFGCVLAVMVILTEPRPAEAARALFYRVACILFPLSVVFGKYFPQIGRNFSIDGTPTFTGITTQKNSLGQMVFVLTLMLVWDWVELRKRGPGDRRKGQEWIRIGMIAMGAWLLFECQSKTSMVCLFIGLLCFLIAGALPKMAHGRGILIGGLALMACLGALDSSLGMTDAVANSLGRDTTLTGRTKIWETLLSQNTNPVLGEGFYSFWDGQKGRAVIHQLRTLNTAHNGYLEMYLDGGMVGVALLVVMLLVGGKRVIGNVIDNAPFGRIGLAFWLTAIIYNFSESSYFRLNILWLVLLLVILRVPGYEADGQSLEIDDCDEEPPWLRPTRWWSRDPL